jgi:hypothetical protein
LTDHESQSSLTRSLRCCARRRPGRHGPGADGPRRRHGRRCPPGGRARRRHAVRGRAVPGEPFTGGGRRLLAVLAPQVAVVIRALQRPGRWSVTATGCSRRRTPIEIASAATCMTGSARRWPGSARACRRCRRSWGASRPFEASSGSPCAAQEPGVASLRSSRIEAAMLAPPSCPEGPLERALPRSGDWCTQCGRGAPRRRERRRAGPLRPTPVGAHGRSP